MDELGERKEVLGAQLDKIIAELKRLHVWEQPEARLRGSFLGRLRYEMIPGIQARLVGKASLPEESNLGIFAIRELDGVVEMEHLTDLLCEFDAIFEGRGPEDDGEEG